MQQIEVIGRRVRLRDWKEACFRKARFVRGEYYDALDFGILREEWRERYPNGFAVDALGTETCNCSPSGEKSC